MFWARANSPAGQYSVDCVFVCCVPFIVIESSHHIAMSSPVPEKVIEQEKEEENEERDSSVEDCFRATIAFAFAFCGMVSNLVVLAIVHERVPRDIDKPLPDLGFSLLPKVDWTLDIAEYIILVVSGLIVFLLFVHRYRYVLSLTVLIIL